RQRRKADAPAALYAQVLAGGPKRVSHDAPAQENSEALEPLAELDDSEDSSNSENLEATPDDVAPPAGDPVFDAAAATAASGDDAEDALGVSGVEREEEEDGEGAAEEGPVHRPLIRATLPRQEGQVPPPRPAPEFTI